MQLYNLIAIILKFKENCHVISVPTQKTKGLNNSHGLMLIIVIICNYDVHFQQY